MPEYMNEQIILGKLDYKALFSIPLWKKLYKENTDKLLKESGHQEFIVPLDDEQKN